MESAPIKDLRYLPSGNLLLLRSSLKQQVSLTGKHLSPLSPCYGSTWDAPPLNRSWAPVLVRITSRIIRLMNVCFDNTSRSILQSNIQVNFLKKTYFVKKKKWKKRETLLKWHPVRMGRQPAVLFQKVFLSSHLQQIFPTNSLLR